jgi:hypothetical protein
MVRGVGLVVVVVVVVTGREENDRGWIVTKVGRGGTTGHT